MTSSFSQPKNVNPGVAEKEEDQKYSASQQSFEPGIFNFGQIMEDFYNYKPGEDDTLGQMQKNAFQGNLVQTAFDSQLASALAEQNSAIAQENMTTKANLEKLKIKYITKD